MNQASIDMGSVPTLQMAQALGQEGMELAAARAERADPGFRHKAQAFVLTYLRKHGKTKGEALVNECKKAGMVPHDDRAFGAVFSGLSRAGLIACAGFCLRTKGHATAGGRVWKAVRK